MNSICRRDTDEVQDYSIEPMGYFNAFIGEYATDYRAVYDMSVGGLEQSILAYAKRRDLEHAMRDLSNNSTKDVRGGAALILNWINGYSGANESRIDRLLTLMGFTDLELSKEPNPPAGMETYHVRKKRQTGKINYNHPIPAFGSLTESEGFRVLCLYGTYDCNALLNAFRTVNNVAEHTLVLLNYAMSLEVRRQLARKIKEEQSFEKSFIVVDRVLLFYLAKHYSVSNINRMLMATAMPFAYYQPFVESSQATMPPELFTGRERELVSIEAANGANLVYGGRQLGKSALLKKAMRDIDGNYRGDRAVLVEIKDLRYDRAAEVVSRKLVIAGILGEDCVTSDWDVLAGHIERRLSVETPGKRINFLLLMLDEADAFISSCKEVDHRPISAMKNLPSDRFKLVMAGLHNLSRFNRDLLLHRNSSLAHLTSVVVRPFKRPEAVKLLTNTLSFLGFHFPDGIVETVLSKTNNFPGLIQFYCQKLLEAMQQDDYAGYHQSTTPIYEITNDHITRVLSDPEFVDMMNQKLESTLFVEEEGRSYYHAIALNLSYLCTESPNDSGHTCAEIMAAARENGTARLTVLNEEQMTELLQEMWDLNIVSAAKIGDTVRYIFSTDAFRRMLGNEQAVNQKLLSYISEEVSEA